MGGSSSSPQPVKKDYTRRKVKLVNPKKVEWFIEDCDSLMKPLSYMAPYWISKDIDNERLEYLYQNERKYPLHFTLDREEPEKFILDFNEMHIWRTNCKEIRRIKRITPDDFVEYLWFFVDRFGKKQIFGHEGEWGSVDINSEWLTDQFMKNSKAIVSYKSNSYSYKLDFKTMIQANEETGVQREVIKVCLLDDFPKLWSFTLEKVILDVPRANIFKIDIADCPIEINQGKGFKISGIGDYTITSAKYIQNEYLWRNYQYSKQRLQVTNGEGKIGEKRIAFHGTTKEAIINIANEGFDPDLAGSCVGALYGNGTYFAKNFSYSAKWGYCPDKEILVARILTGQSTVGQEGLDCAPYLDTNYPDKGTYDSCKDAANPIMHIIFNREQIYPEYILKFE